MSDNENTACPYVTGDTTRFCTLTPFTLTPEERLAIADAADRYAEITPESVQTAATLRGLLERCSQFAKRESDRPQPIADARLAALQQLAELDEELGQPRCTPNPLATPGEGTYPPKCTETGGT